MKSEWKPIPTRPFTNDEKAALSDYLKDDCDPGTASVRDGEHSADSNSASESDNSHISQPKPEYSAYIDQFLRTLNTRPSDPIESRQIALARKTVRDLYESRALPRCQMLAMCTYVNLCAAKPISERLAKSYIDTRIMSANQVRSVKTHLIKLSKALEKEQSAASQLYRFPMLNKDILLIVELMSACLPAIQEIQDIRRPFFSIADLIRRQAVLRRMARDGFLNPPHPRHLRASAADAEIILPVLHEALIGAPPDEKVITLYLENNTQRDLGRFDEEETIAKINAMEERFNTIVPEFKERIRAEDLKDITKRPLELPVSTDCSEIMLLAQIHSSSVQSGDKSGSIQAVQIMLEIMVAANSCDKARGHLINA